MFAVTFSILLMGSIQLYFLRNDRKVDFTYKVYIDFMVFLKDNSDLKEWLLGKTATDKLSNEYRAGDLLERFEAIWALKGKSAIDEDIMYALISWYVEMAFETAKAREYIKKARSENEISYPDDLFAGTEKLYQWIVRITNHKKANKIID